MMLILKNWYKYGRIIKHYIYIDKPYSKAQGCHNISRGL